MCVQPGAVYEWWTKYAGQKAKPPRKPPDYDRGKQNRNDPTKPPEKDPVKKWTSLSSAELMLEAANSTESGQQRKALIDLAQAVQRREEKASKSMALSDVITTVRAAGEMMVNALESNIPALVESIMAAIRDNLDVNLNQNPNAQRVLQHAIAVNANKKLIPSIRARVEQDIDKVRLLDLEP